MGNQRVHGNTWVVSGNNWASTRQASPTQTNKPYYVKTDDYDIPNAGASAKMMSMTQASVLQRTANLQTAGRTGLITNAAAGIEASSMSGELRGNKMGPILLETKQQEVIGLDQLSKHS